MAQIISRFDKKALLKKIIPLLINTMKINTQLSVNILPAMLQLVSQDGFVTMTEFREIIWPGISLLCKAKELPAQSIFIICKNAEIFQQNVSQEDFQTFLLPLLLKALDCNVPKL